MRTHSAWREIRFGVGRVERGTRVPRHQHLSAYATLVLSGSYEQASYGGRFRVGPGDVLIQPTLDFHSDILLTPDVLLVRLPWGRETSFGGVYRGVSSELLLRVAERDPFEAACLLKEQLVGKQALPSRAESLSDTLAGALQRNPDLRIISWARSNGLTRECLWRWFTRDFGVSPTQFRSEIRARGAWLAVTGSREQLCRIATESGFADQAHMTRAIKALTGATPARWRDVLRSKWQSQQHAGANRAARPL